MTYSYGSVYIGDWVNDQPEGKGEVKKANYDLQITETYNGEWKASKMHGKGILVTTYLDLKGPTRSVTYTGKFFKILIIYVA